MKIRFLILAVLIVVCNLAFAVDPWGTPTVLTGSETVMAQVSINSVPAVSGDVLAAFVTVGAVEQLRGKGSIMVNGGVAGCLVQIYTESNGEQIVFKVWDESAQAIVPVTQTLTSEVGGIVGEYPNNLYQINAGTGTQTVATPSFTPAAGTYTAAQSVTIACSTAGAQIRYTTNGSDPTETSTLYSTAINVAATTTLKAKAFLTGWTASAVATAVYTIGGGMVTDPWGTPAILTGSETVMAQVSINSVPAVAGDVLAAFVTVGAVEQLRGKQAILVTGGVAGCLIQIYTESNGEQIAFKVWDYSAQAIVPVTQTLSSEVGGIVGEYPNNLYQINAGTGTQTDPWGTPTILTGSETVMAQVSINSVPAVTGDIIAAFVTVGTEEQLRGKEAILVTGGIAGCLLHIYTETNGEQIVFKVWDYSAQLIVPVTQTLNSEVGGIIGNYPDNLYPINAGTGAQAVALPTFTPGAGTYSTSQNVALSCATPSAQIRYTTNGADPTATSTLYSAAINVATTTTLKAKAFLAGWTPSAVATAIYTITGTVATPAFTPAAGTYTSARNVSISCATAGAQIRYTTNGADPTATSTLYSAAINVATTTTLKAKAFLAGWTPSAVTTAIYTINGTVATPTFNPEPGQYQNYVDVTLSCITVGAQIRYTLDASEPSETSSLYSQPIHINLTTLIRARAFLAGWTPSSFSEGMYDIPVANPEVDVTSVITGISNVYPNPFSTSTTIQLGIKEANQAYQVKIYNIKGECVYRTEGNAKGSFELNWNGYSSDGKRLPSGIYLISFNSGEIRQIRKIVMQ
ncbi:MAG: chitobiase/beta-hexosaminidase C-terminal domain-containing protein [Candidatus Cloacimonetes bacterium]|nr:chitobiase/beta-hexosaminidase C-terminal domain-containing protein [Candidatus Cloacimonadota bacterium]